MFSNKYLGAMFNNKYFGAMFNNKYFGAMFNNKQFGAMFNNKYFGVKFNSKHSALKLCLSPHSIFVLHINLTTNSHHLPTQHHLSVLSNEGTLCSL